jgi:hypothetical protein
MSRRGTAALQAGVATSEREVVPHGARVAAFASGVAAFASRVAALVWRVVPVARQLDPFARWGPSILSDNRSFERRNAAIGRGGHAMKCSRSGVGFRDVAIGRGVAPIATRDGPIRLELRVIAFVLGSIGRWGAARRREVHASGSMVEADDARVGPVARRARAFRSRRLPFPSRNRAIRVRDGASEVDGVAPNCHLRRTTCPLLAARVGRRLIGSSRGTFDIRAIGVRAE